MAKKNETEKNLTDENSNKTEEKEKAKTDL